MLYGILVIVVFTVCTWLYLITAVNSNFTVMLMTIILAYDLIKMLFSSYLFAF